MSGYIILISLLKYQIVFPSERKKIHDSDTTLKYEADKNVLYLSAALTISDSEK